MPRHGGKSAKKPNSTQRSGRQRAGSRGAKAGRTGKEAAKQGASRSGVRNSAGKPGAGKSGAGKPGAVKHGESKRVGPQRSSSPKAAHNRAVSRVSSKARASAGQVCSDRGGRPAPAEQATEPAKSTVSFVTIEPGREGQRLDNFLFTHLKGVPKSLIYRIIRDGQVRVNKKRAKQTTRLEINDEVRIPPIRTAQAATVAPKVGKELAQRLQRSLIHEDKHLLIYNKPAGMAVHGGSGISLGLIETLRAMRPEDTQLELVHRLDRETSGCVMLAKKRSFLRRLQQLMKDGDIDKRYWLLCRGFKGTQRTIDAPLLKMMQGSERIVRVSRDGKPSVTHFHLIERFGDIQLLEAKLETGRTHQIRVHACHGGFPLLGDIKYGNAQINNQLKAAGHGRMYLHARQLAFDHPDGGKVNVQAQLDEHFEGLLDALRNGLILNG